MAAGISLLSDRRIAVHLWRASHPCGSYPTTVSSHLGKVPTQPSNPATPPRLANAWSIATDQIWLAQIQAAAPTGQLNILLLMSIKIAHIVLSMPATITENCSFFKINSLPLINK